MLPAGAVAADALKGTALETGWYPARQSAHRLTILQPGYNPFLGHLCPLPQVIAQVHHICAQASHRYLGALLAMERTRAAVLVGTLRKIWRSW